MRRRGCWDIEERKTHFDILPILVPRRLAEERPHDEHAKGIQAPIPRLRNHARHARKQHELIVLAQIAHKVIDARPLRHPPPGLPRPILVQQEILHAQHERVRPLPRGLRVRQEFGERRLVVVVQRGTQAGLEAVVEEHDAPAVGRARVRRLFLRAFPVAPEEDGAREEEREHAAEHVAREALSPSVARGEVGACGEGASSSAAGAAGSAGRRLGRVQLEGIGFLRGMAKLFVEGGRDALCEIVEGKLGRLLGSFFFSQPCFGRVDGRGRGVLGGGVLVGRRGLEFILMFGVFGA